MGKILWGLLGQFLKSRTGQVMIVLLLLGVGGGACWNLWFVPTFLRTSPQVAVTSMTQTPTLTRYSTLMPAGANTPGGRGGNDTVTPTPVSTVGALAQPGGIVTTTPEVFLPTPRVDNKTPMPSPSPKPAGSDKTEGDRILSGSLKDDGSVKVLNVKDYPSTMGAPVPTTAQQKNLKDGFYVNYFVSAYGSTLQIKMGGNYAYLYMTEGGGYIRLKHHMRDRDEISNYSIGGGKEVFLLDNRWFIWPPSSGGGQWLIAEK